MNGHLATEWRQMVAHGVSRGQEGGMKTSRGAAKEHALIILLSPHPGLANLNAQVPTAHAVGYHLSLLRS
jgi:hypothetical protein